MITVGDLLDVADAQPLDKMIHLEGNDFFICDTGNTLALRIAGCLDGERDVFAEIERKPFVPWLYPFEENKK